MKAALKTSKGDFEIGDVAQPQITKPDQAMARVKVAGICGTDLRHWKEPNPKTIGKIVGHEMAGEIVEVGKDVKDLKIGDRVVIETVMGDDTCDWCKAEKYNLCPNLYEIRSQYLSRAFGEFVVGPAKKFYKLPDNVSFEEAALLDTFAVSLHACHVTGLKINDKIAIIGAGPIGLGLLELSQIFGCTALITDVIDFPLSVAIKLGAEVVVNTKKEDGYEKVMEFTRKRGVDIAFESAGGKAIQTTFPQSVSYARIGGKVGLVGGFDEGVTPIALDWQHLQKAEIQLIPCASYAFWDIYSEMKICLELLAAGKLDAKSLITDRFSLDDINKAFEVTNDKEHNDSIFTAISI